MSIRNEFKAGLFVLIALALFAVSVFSLGRERQLFAKQAQFFVIFSDAKGLSSGAPVRLGGITVGRVADISFAKDLGDVRIFVKLLVDERFSDRITDGIAASIETQGLLGDRFISLIVLEHNNEVVKLQPGSKIASREAGDLSALANKAERLLDNILTISNEVRETLQGTDGKSAGFAKLIDQMNTIAAEISNGSGLLHSVIYDPQGKGIIASLSSSVKDISSAAGEIKILAKELREGGGDKKGVREMMAKLYSASLNIEKAAQALAQGTGTLGALIFDSRVYDNLLEATEGAKRSFVLRQAIKSSLDNKK